MRSRSTTPIFKALSLAVLSFQLAACSSEPSSAEAAKVSAPSVAASPSPAIEGSDGVPRSTLSGDKKGTVVWTQMSPITSPSASTNVSMAFDDAAGVPILFNGEDRAFWTWNGTDWTKLPWPAAEPDPGDRDSEIVFDSERGRVVLYGGFDAFVTGPCQRCNDTWEWFNGEWAQRNDVGNAGGPRNNHSLVYDPVRKVTVLTGGFVPANDPQLDSATWEYDGTSWVEAVAVGSGYSPERWLHATAFDPDRGKTVLFGGANLTRATRYADTWEYDGTSWANVTPSGASPSVRHSHAMVYDSVRKVTVLYGGEAINTSTIQWEWDGTSWTNMPVGAPNPGGRHDHAMTFDPVRKRVVLFGGHDATTMNDTWEMYVRGNSCVTSDDCHTGFCVDGVCCETACDGACEACTADVTGGEDGVCAPILAGTDPDDECQEGAGLDAACVPGTCDGAGACRVNAGVTCQAGSCLDPSTAQPEGVCSAAGTCEAPAPKSCLWWQSCEDGVCGGEVPIGDDGGGVPDADVPSDAGDDAAVDAGDELVPTKTTLSTSTPVIEDGTSVAIDVKVTAEEGTPTGTVTLRDAEVTIGSATLEEGEARITITLTGTGEHDLVALYPGSDSHAASVSSPLVITVNGAGSGEYRLVGGGCSQAGGASGNAGYWAVFGAALVMAASQRRRDVDTVGRG